MAEESSNEVQPSEESSQQVPVDVLADSFMGRLRNGERPSINEYAAKHPALADEIRELFPTLAMLENYGVDEPDSITATAATPQHIGDYQIIREVGRGGMGVVYEAEQLSMGRRVALKVLPFAALIDPKALQRFQNEVRAPGDRTPGAISVSGYGARWYGCETGRRCPTSWSTCAGAGEACCPLPARCMRVRQGQ